MLVSDTFGDSLHAPPSTKVCGGAVRSNRHHHQHDFFVSTTAAQFISAGAAAATSSALYNPLDCLRVRWQIAPRADPAVAQGLLRYGLDIIKNEGLIAGLWKPGLGANVGGMCLSAALRFGSYETVRDSLVSLSAEHTSAGKEERDARKSGAHMVASGLICGAFAYSVTTPFHLLKTMIQAEKGVIGPGGIYLSGARAGKKVHVQGFFTGFAVLVRDGGVSRLWKGMMPLSLRGALFTAGQMLGYDGLKTFAKQHGVEDGPSLHVMSSFAASFGASFLSAPADLIMAKYMTATNGESLFTCVEGVYAQNGLIGFWRGWSLFFIRLTPVMLTYSTLYEQIRFKLGLGYF